MRLYAKTCRITTFITLLALIACLMCHYFHISNYEVDFWLNIALSIFTGGFLTAVTSLIGYLSERRKALERFRTLTLNIARTLLAYETDWDDMKKVDFFLNLLDQNRDDWHDSFGDIFFLFDPFNRNRNYIAWKLYKPMRDLFIKIGEHKRNLIRCKNIDKEISRIQSNKIETVETIELLKGFKNKRNSLVFPSIRDIEITLTKEWLYQTDSPIGSIQCTDNSSFARTYFDEFNGRYYELMYGKRRQGEGE